MAENTFGPTHPGTNVLRHVVPTQDEEDDVCNHTPPSQQGPGGSDWRNRGCWKKTPFFVKVILCLLLTLILWFTFVVVLTLIADSLLQWIGREGGSVPPTGTPSPQKCSKRSVTTENSPACAAPLTSDYTLGSSTSFQFDLCAVIVCYGGELECGVFMTSTFAMTTLFSPERPQNANEMAENSGVDGCGWLTRMFGQWKGLI